MISSFISQQIKKIRENKLEKSVKIYPEFMGDKKMEFFRDVDVISVPVNKYDGYGLYILEANAAGIPVVQPATGAFPEIIERTKGGIIYSPDTVSELASNLHKLLKNRQLISRSGRSRQENGQTGTLARKDVCRTFGSIHKNND